MLTRTRSEQGFTLIEMVVAMVIGMIVLGIFVSVVTQAWLRGADADAQGMASARITEVLDRISDDVRSSRKPDRADVFQTATKDELRVQLEENPIRYGDLAVATGRQLSVYTNGDGSANALCATWSFQQVDDGRRNVVWALTRRLDPDCTPGVNQNREVLAPLPEGVTPSPDTFRYGVLGAPGPTGECPVVMRAPGAGGALNPDQRLRTIAVHVDLAAGAARGKNKARARVGRDVIGMWSRLNDDYYFAVGCAQ